jgi:hypothetical protein
MRYVEKQSFFNESLNNLIEKGYIEMEDLLGKTIVHIKNEDDREIYFFFSDFSIVKMYHVQDCCEDVSLEDIVGDINDLIGEPLLLCEESTQDNTDDEVDTDDDSYTWTFYKFATVKGYVTMRWYGTSNGYYSESVDLRELKGWKTNG